MPLSQVVWQIAQVHHSGRLGCGYPSVCELIPCVDMRMGRLHIFEPLIDHYTSPPSDT